MYVHVSMEHQQSHTFGDTDGLCHCLSMMLVRLSARSTTLLNDVATLSDLVYARHVMAIEYRTSLGTLTTHAVIAVNGKPVME